MTLPWSFGVVGPALETSGFQVLPITRPHPSDKDLGKKPPSTLLEWQVPAPAASRLPRYAGCGTGILTANTPAVDIDVRHAEIADAIDRIVVEELGEGPIRYGQAPKRLRVYRASEPFGKTSTQGFVLPGDEPGAKAHKVEILGDGQQFVAYGIHPVTGYPYVWPDDDLLNIERADLPEITLELARMVVQRADVILARAGRVASVTRTTSAPRSAWRPGQPPRAIRDLGEARRVLAILSAIDPSTLDYDTWVATAYGVKAALGDHGREVWIAWSAMSTKHGVSGRHDTPMKVWTGARPERCGWRYLERLLTGGHQHG